MGSRRVAFGVILTIVLVFPKAVFCGESQGAAGKQGVQQSMKSPEAARFSDIIADSPLDESHRKMAHTNIDDWLQKCSGIEMDNLMQWASRNDLMAIISTAARSPLVCAPGVPVAEDPAAYGQHTILSLPIGGIWHVVQGNQGLVSHLKGEKGEFAWDFVINRNGYQAQGDANLNENHYCWEQPVLAPAPGRVVQTRDDLDDHRPYLPDPPHVGNHVYIDHQNGEISLLYHLKKDSVLVKTGDMVERGQPIGLCGNTGISMFPHLHFQLYSGTLEKHEKLPTRFAAYYSWRGPDDQNPDRGEMKLNLSGVPKRLENVANLNYFLTENVHKE